MSAQVIRFPSKPPHIANKLRHLREAISARADATNANSEQRLRALAAALTAIEDGQTAYVALASAYRHLPSVRNGKRQACLVALDYIRAVGPTQRPADPFTPPEAA